MPVTDGPIRKHVAPAHPAASIPDPDRRRLLPPEGVDTDWSPYWAALELRGDVVVTDVVPEPPAEAPAEPLPATP